MHILGPSFNGFNSNQDYVGFFAGVGFHVFEASVCE